MKNFVGFTTCIWFGALLIGILFASSMYPLLVLVFGCFLIIPWILQAREMVKQQEEETLILKNQLLEANRVGREVGIKLAHARAVGLKWKNAFLISHNQSPQEFLEDE